MLHETLPGGWECGQTLVAVWISQVPQKPRFREKNQKTKIKLKPKQQQQPNPTTFCFLPKQKDKTLEEKTPTNSNKSHTHPPLLPKPSKSTFLKTGYFYPCSDKLDFLCSWLVFFSSKELLLCKTSFLLSPLATILIHECLKSITPGLHFKPLSELHLWTKVSGSNRFLIQAGTFRELNIQSFIECAHPLY